jgi:DNA invertase Pin-like site-specific DNA recombinase
MERPPALRGLHGGAIVTKQTWLRVASGDSASSLAMTPILQRPPAVLARPLACCLYARVSSELGPENSPQHPENQLVPLREFAARQGYTVAAEYVDRMSGAKAERPQFQRLMADARTGKWQVVCFWSLDRFSRLPMAETLLYLQALRDAGVQFRSLQEPHIDTTGPMGWLVIAIIATMSDIERLRIKDRALEGMARYRADVAAGRPLKSRSGKNLPPGRPRVVVDRWRVREMADAGASVRQIAREFGIGKSTAAVILRDFTDNVETY